MIGYAFRMSKEIEIVHDEYSELLAWAGTAEMAELPAQWVELARQGRKTGISIDPTELPRVACWCQVSTLEDFGKSQSPKEIT